MYGNGRKDVPAKETASGIFYISRVGAPDEKIRLSRDRETGSDLKRGDADGRN